MVDLTARVPRLLTWTSMVLLLLALLRMAVVVLSEPVVGYGNQYDMHRTSACVGLWPESIDIGLATPQAPQPVYERRAIRWPDCYPGTQVGIVAVAMFADSVMDTLRSADNDQVSLRWIGFCGLLIWGALLLGVGWLFRGQPLALLAHAGVTLLLLSDPFNTLYLNTLYTEFPALISAYAACAVVVSLWLRPEAARRRLIVLGMLLLLLGLSRVQHLALPFLFMVLAVLALWRADRSWLRPGVFLLLVCGTVVAIQAAQQHRFVGIARANIADTVLGAAMPAGDPEQVARELGLPQHCAELAYSTWYRQHGVDVFVECPELNSVSRIRLLAVSLRHPSMLARMLLRGVLMSQNLRLGYLGERAGAEFASIDHSDGLAHASVAAAINKVSPPVFLLVAVAALVLVPGFGLLLLWRRRMFLKSLRADSVLILACAAAFALVLFSSVFGDGYSEVGRHLHLGLNALLVMAVWGPIWCMRRLLRRASVGRGSPAGQWIGAGAAIGAVAGLMWWSLQLPLAFGVLAEPEAAPADSGIVVIRGWALDSAALNRIAVRVDGRELMDLDPVVHERLDQVFPYLSRNGSGGFSGRIAAEKLVGARFLEIIAIDARGQSVTIERRRLRN